jgi:hypothetical protein
VGVAAGRYRLEIRANGYLTWNGPEIVSAEGEELDVGAIELEPAAALLLTVVDESGIPLQGCTLTLDGDRLPAYLARVDEAGAYGVQQLAPGPQVVVVQAAGFLKGEVLVELVANEQTEERVVLLRE